MALHGLILQRQTKKRKIMIENNICKTCEHVNILHEHFTESGIILKEFTVCKDYIQTKNCFCTKFISMSALEYFNFLVKKRIESLKK